MCVLLPAREQVTRWAGSQLPFDPKPTYRKTDQRMNKATVCFISFVTFDEDVFQKVIEIIKFWKKFLKADGDAFYDTQLPGLFYKNLCRMTNDKRLFIISKKHHYLGFLVEQVFFKLLLSLNGLSYKYQIGLKLKLIHNSFKKCKQGNFSSIIYHIRHDKN